MQVLYAATLNHRHNHHLPIYLYNTFTSTEMVTMHLSFHKNEKTRRNQDNEQMNALKTLNKKVKEEEIRQGYF